MKKIKKSGLKVNFTWIFVGNVVFSFSQWLLLIIIARLQSPEAVGLYSIAIAINTPISMFLNFQLRSLNATDIDNDFEFKDYMGFRILTVIASIIIVGTIAMFSYELSYTTLIICVVAIIKGAESISDITYGVFQKKQIMNYIGISKIIIALSTVFVTYLTLKITDSLLITLLAISIVEILKTLLFDFQKVKQMINVKPRFSFNKMKTLLVISFPLGLASLIISINTNIPRYFIEYHISLEALGYFSAIASLLTAGRMLILPLGQAVSPQLAINYKKDIKLFKKLLIKLMIFSSILGLVGLIISIFFGEPILRLVYGEEYSRYSSLLILIMVSMCFTYYTSFLNQALIVMRKYKEQPLVNILSLIAALVSSLILIPQYKLVGAGLVLIITYFIQLLGTLYILIKNMRNNNN